MAGAVTRIVPLFFTESPFVHMGNLLLYALQGEGGVSSTVENSETGGVRPTGALRRGATVSKRTRQQGGRPTSEDAANVRDCGAQPSNTGTLKHVR